MSKDPFNELEEIYVEKSDGTYQYRGVYVNQTVKRQSKINPQEVKIACFILVILSIIALIHHTYTRLPSHVLYIGTFGHYNIYPYEGEIHTPDGTILNYVQSGQRVVSYFITYPDGSTLSMNTKYPRRKILSMSDFPLTDEELDLWYGLTSVKPKLQGSGNPFRLVHILASFSVCCCGLACIYIPHRVADVFIFLIDDLEPLLQTKTYYFYVKKAGFVIASLSGVYLLIATFLM